MIGGGELSRVASSVRFLLPRRPQSTTSPQTHELPSPNRSHVWRARIFSYSRPSLPPVNRRYATIGIPPASIESSRHRDSRLSPSRQRFVRTYELHAGYLATASIHREINCFPLFYDRPCHWVVIQSFGPKLVLFAPYPAHKVAI